MTPLCHRTEFLLVGALAALAPMTSCKKRESAPPPAASSSAAPSAVPVDRLAPGELAPGQVALFGLLLPRGMQLQGQFDDQGYAFGPLDAEAVANYVRTHVDVARVEVGAARTIFPAARVKAAKDEHIYRIEVVREGAATRVVMADVTPKPPRKLEPMSDAERWRRAGFTPDGKPLDPKALE
jgi:hypothetical protein